MPIETLAVLAAPLIIIAIFPHRWIALAFTGALVAAVIYANRFAFASIRDIDAWAAFGLFAIVVPLAYGAVLFGVIALRRWANRRKQAVLAGSGEQLAQQIAAWIQAETSAGARLFAIEALMGAGKTTTTKQIRDLLPALETLWLDSFLDKNVPHGRPWSEMYDLDEAVRHAAVHLKNDSPLLIEGAICWPTARACNAETRYIYLKRMRPSDVWVDEPELTGNLKHPTLRRMVRDHQVRTEPWKHADLIIERLAEPDEPS